MKRILVASFATLFLVACGGGGSGGSSTQTIANIAGVYEGATSNNKTIGGLIDRKGDLWLTYEDNNDSQNQGLVVGSLSVNGTKVSSAAKDFSSQDKLVTAFSLEGEVNIGKTFSGVSTNPITGEKVVFNTTYVPTKPETKATYNQIVGNYAGKAVTLSASGETSFSVDTNGNLKSSAGSCAYAGKLTPVNLSNVSYYELSVTFANSTACLLPNKTVVGVANFDVEDNGLYLMGKTQDMADILISFSAKK